MTAGADGLNGMGRRPEWTRRQGQAMARSDRSDTIRDSALRRRDEPREVALWRKVRFLSSPRAYLPRPEAVQVVETHMAWIFLTDREAYKLKKPVRYPFLDFSSLTAREADCREEVRLNRRLAPDVYLGVAPLTQEPSGRLALGGSGRVVDWLVRMRRLSAECMLDQAIARGGPERRDVERLAGLLAAFYATQEPADIDADTYIGRFRSQHALNMDVLQRFGELFDGQRLHEVASAVEAFLDSGRGILEERVRQGRIVDGHGDLRPEHICLAEPPAIIDCLEFNRFLRLVDPLDDIAYLDLECALLGAGWIGGVVRARIESALRDQAPRALLAFYTVFRAMLRARLALAHLIEPRKRRPDHWPSLAQAYLDAARRSCGSIRADQP